MTQIVVAQKEWRVIINIMINKHKNKLILFFMASGLLLYAWNLEAPFVEGSSGTFFGGQVVSKVACTCSAGSQVTIKGPGQSSGTYLDLGTAKAFQNYSISTGGNIVGKYSTGGQCLVGVSPECTTLPITKGTIVMFGSSR